MLSFDNHYNHYKTIINNLFFIFLEAEDVVLITTLNLIYY